MMLNATKLIINSGSIFVFIFVVLLTIHLRLIFRGLNVL